jgi:serine protease Do
MKRASLFLLVGLLLISSVVSAQEIYRWTDDKGVAHFTDDPSLIPEKYRGQIKTERIPVESSPSAPQAQPQAVPSGPPSVNAADPSSGRKDVLGRGEDWWKAQAKMWKEKLQDAQKNYETANAAVKTKQKEIDDAIFKPDSYKRRLEAEKKDLQDKVNESAKQVDDAKNMLETGLTRQAEEYLADPAWVK